MPRDSPKRSCRRILRFCRSHVVLQPSWNSLNSFGAEVAVSQAHGQVVRRARTICHIWLSLLYCTAFCSSSACADKLAISPEVLAVADQIYSGDLDGGRTAALRLQEQQPQHPIG